MSDVEAERYGEPQDASSVLGSADAPGPGAAEIGGGAEPEAPEQDPARAEAEARVPKAFDPRYREKLIGLLYLGRLEDTFTWAGHTFVIRTLTVGEQIEAGLLIQPALGTRVEMKAHASSMVAAGLVSVDGQPLITPLTIADPTMREKYTYLLEKWHSVAVDVVYSRIYELEVEARRLTDALGEAVSQGA